MPCEVESRFLVLYGSQKGQAQSIAEEISELASEHGFTAEISCLSNVEKYNLDSERGPVVFVVSTTGDGEPPDTALRFVKKIKSLPSDHFSHLHYALLALGDTNYANFCNCGKTIDRRLQQLGARHFYPTGHADDGTGLEIVVDPWIEGLWDALKKAFAKMSATNQEATAQGAIAEKKTEQDSQIQEKLDSSVVSLHLLKLSDVETKKNVAEPSVSESENSETSGAPLGASLIRSVPPLSGSSLNVPALPSSFLDVCLEEIPAEEVEGAQEDAHHVAEEGFYEVPVSRALHLTGDDAVKSAILLQLDLSDQDLLYQPGDAFDVRCPNRDDEVEQLLLRLGLKHQRNQRVHLQLRKDTKKKGAQLPSYIPKKCSLEYLLTWCLEIRSTPKKAFVRSLVEWTRDGGEKRRLQELCSREGSADYNRFIRDTNTCLLDLLQAFKSCSPPLSLLIEHLPKLQPRAYSAASSGLRTPGRVDIVFSLVEFPACPEHPERTGLCSGWLTHHVSTILQPSGTKVLAEKARSDSPKIHIRPRANNIFRLPPDPSVPLVMVGPGTGVAPFIGFLQQREKEREEKKDTAFGETWLFFGCRHKDKDFIFREELEKFVENGTLNHLKVSFSRDEPDGNEPKTKYVQHQMLLHSKNIVSILLAKNGCLYVCGDAKNMAKDVNDALMEMIAVELQLDKLESMKTLAKLREEKRYLQDIWS
ncbi:methionine synthase reductase [Hoplias malabaricus]|uniref:methionine synthase reductase n=1 Tax=Hoplias malabaricus TaxID=27720 RepID=UPI0034632A8D